MGWVQSIKALFASSATSPASQDFQGPGGSVESLVRIHRRRVRGARRRRHRAHPVHAEIDDGVTRPAVFYLVAPGKLRYVDATDQLECDAYALWESWKGNGNAEWRVMNYLIVDGKLSIDYVYPEQIDESENLVAQTQAHSDAVLRRGPGRVPEALIALPVLLKWSTRGLLAMRRRAVTAITLVCMSALGCAHDVSNVRDCSVAEVRFVGPTRRAFHEEAGGQFSIRNIGRSPIRVPVWGRAGVAWRLW